MRKVPPKRERPKCLLHWIVTCELSQQFIPKDVIVQTSSPRNSKSIGHSSTRYNTCVKLKHSILKSLSIGPFHIIPHPFPARESTVHLRREQEISSNKHQHLSPIPGEDRLAKGMTTILCSIKLLKITFCMGLTQSGLLEEHVCVNYQWKLSVLHNWKKIFHALKQDIYLNL